MAESRSSSWRWWVCGLLLLASMINYMDRQTLANAAVRITKQFGLNQEQYGDLEFGFGYGFAAGSIVFGFLADRVSVRWLYPAVLLLWSVTGFMTGWAEDYSQWLAGGVSDCGGDWFGLGAVLVVDGARAGFGSGCGDGCYERRGVA